jgi:poly(A) polymerase
LSNPAEKAAAALRVIPRSEHNISRANISKAAVKVLYRLKDGGFQAYLVGGSVRDLLLDRHPKDFDVATDATPEQVAELFNNARLIGRRFRIAHVRFGREIIEVATLRAGANSDEDDHSVAEGSGRVLRDNVWGTIEDDVWRRDLTANALYYDISDFSIRDYVGGVEDIRAGRLRLLGDPEQRYREDPVRMLRTARFAAKLGFAVDPASAEPISRLAGLLDNIPPARLFDEFGKLFQSGHAAASWQQLQQFDLVRHLFPATAHWLANDADGRRARFITTALEQTDARIAVDKPVTPMFLLAVLLWGPVRETASRLIEHEDMSEVQALVVAGAEVVGQQCSRVAFPKRFTLPAREIMQMQPRFLKRQGKRAHALLGHRRFRAAYDLLLLRATLGEVEPELVDAWTKMQEDGGAADVQERAPKARSGQRRRRRRKSKNSD